MGIHTVTGSSWKFDSAESTPKANAEHYFQFLGYCEISYLCHDAKFTYLNHNKTNKIIINNYNNGKN